ncbi:MAG: N-succinylglutamate 5-semialdehyde dehydrogenase [Phycisphaerae bacterium]|nr:N-succinylglutamate 5-semialdehyde dehydrogenase [Phycisphaerae bacterium]
MTSVSFPKPCDVIDGSSRGIPGEALISRNPADPNEVIWSGAPSGGHVDQAVAAARNALPAWMGLSIDQRADHLRSWRDVASAHVDELAELIGREVGKPSPEARIEATAIAGKVDLTLESTVMDRIQDWTADAGTGRTGRCRYRPHGVMAVIGPFNFPAHLPNGQFVPALLAGNTVVFKPSELAPAVGQRLGELMQEAGLPPGVFNVVHGMAGESRRLCMSEGVDGILFTGSWPVGRAILEQNLDTPGRIVALELGGNNPAIVHEDADVRLAAIECARAAFATTGQRCTCTRRIIVHEKVADSFLAALCTTASTLLIGAHDDPVTPFMGPLITESAREAVLESQRKIIARGGRSLVPAVELPRDGWFISAGIIEVDGFHMDHDEEIFGPLVQVCTVSSLDEAIRQAQQTRYGLAASIFTADQSNFDHCFAKLSTGCLNWNVGTAGASSRLPFGGVGLSGNHRPAAALAIDSCAYPVASLLQPGSEIPIPTGMTWKDEWLAMPSSDG